MAGDQRVIDIVLKITDTDYKKKMEEARSELKLLKSDLEVTNSEFRGHEDSLEAMGAKYNALQPVIAQIKTELEIENEAIAKGREALESTKSIIDEYKAKVSAASDTLATLKERQELYSSQLGPFRERLNGANQKLQEAQSVVDGLNEKYTGVTRNLPWFQRRMADANAEVDKAQHEVNDAKVALDALWGAYTKTTAAIDDCNREIDEGNEEIKKLNELEGKAEAYIRKHQTAANKLQVEINKLTTEHARLQNEMKKLADAGVQSEEEYKKLQKEAEEYEKQLEKLRQEEQKHLDLVEAAAFTTVIKLFKDYGNAIVACVDSYKELETAMIGVSKTTNLSDEELKNLQEDFKALSTTIPVSAVELAKIAELGGQLGVSNEGLETFAKTIANIAVSTNLDIEEAATNMAQFANIVGLTEQQYENMGSAIVELGNNFATDEKTIMLMSERFAAAGVAAGMSATDIAAFSAAAGSLGMRADAGASGLTKFVETVNDVVHTGEGLEDFAKIAGMSAEEFRRAFFEDSATAMAAFLEGLGNTGSELSTVAAELGFADIRVKRVVTSLALAQKNNDLLTRSIEAANEAFKDNIALQTEAEKFYGSLENQTVLLNNALDNLKSTVGEQLEPAVAGIVSLGKDGVILLNNILTEFPALIPMLEIVSSMMLGLALVSLPKTFDSIGMVIEKFQLLGTNMKNTLTTGIDLIKTGLTPEVAAMAVAIAGVAIAWNIAKKARDLYGEQVVESNRYEHESIKDMQSEAAVLTKLEQHQKRLNELKIKSARHPFSVSSTEIEEEAKFVEELTQRYEELQYAKEHGGKTEAEVSAALLEEEERLNALAAAYEKVEKNVIAADIMTTKYNNTARLGYYEAMENMQSQLDWQESYLSSIETVLSWNNDAINEWVATWNDGSQEAKEKMNLLARNTEEDAITIMNKYQEVEEKGAELSGKIVANNEAAQTMQEWSNIVTDNIDFAVDYGIRRVGELNRALSNVGGVNPNPFGNVGFSTIYHAQGLAQVPYDNYPAMLHEGEMVLSRAAARMYREAANTQNYTTSNTTFNIYEKPNENSELLARRINRIMGGKYTA